MFISVLNKYANSIHYTYACCFHNKYFNIILPSVFGSPSDIFSSCLPTKIICNFLPSVSHIMSVPSHSMLMVQFMKTSSSQCKFFHSSVAWYLLSPNILLISLFTPISVLPLQWNTNFEVCHPRCVSNKSNYMVYAYIITHNYVLGGVLFTILHLIHPLQMHVYLIDKFSLYNLMMAKICGRNM